MKKVGLFGGTFDPVHIGHLLMARTAMEQMKLDEVIFIPSCVPPHKTTPTLFDVKDRMAMVRLATKSVPAFKVSDFEVKKGGRSYSVDTVRHFCEVYPAGTRLFFIVGGDAIKQLDTWKDSEELQKLCAFVSVNRPGYPRGETKFKYRAVTMNGIELSSTEIRKRILSGKSIQFLVPGSVLSYIRRKNQYPLK